MHNNKNKGHAEKTVLKKPEQFCTSLRQANKIKPTSCPLYNMQTKKDDN